MYSALQFNSDRSWKISEGLERSCLEAKDVIKSQGPTQRVYPATHHGFPRNPRLVSQVIINSNWVWASGWQIPGDFLCHWTTKVFLNFFFFFTFFSTGKSPEASASWVILEHHCTRSPAALAWMWFFPTPILYQSWKEELMWGFAPSVWHPRIFAFGGSFLTHERANRESKRGFILGEIAWCFTFYPCPWSSAWNSVT